MPSLMRSATLMCIAALVLGGCSDDSGGPQPRSQPDGELGPQAEAGHPEPAAQDAPAEDDEASPLEEYSVTFEHGSYYSLGGGGSAELTEDQIKEIREYEERVQSCMAEQGFEYIPHIVTDLAQPAPLSEAYRLPPAEFAEQYGYGTTTIDFPAVDDARSEVVKNPNDEIRDQLSSEALAAYDRALYGAKPDETGGSVEEGCASGAATEMTITETSVIGDALAAAGLDPLREDLFALTDRLRQSPRLDQASAQWLGCMAEAGHFFDGTADPAPVAGPAELDGMGTVDLGRRDVMRRAEELTGWADLLDELPEGYSGEIEPPDIEIDPDELRDLQQYEIALATADHACRVEHFDQVLRDVRHELESEFLEAHQDELERFREHAARR